LDGQWAPEASDEFERFCEITSAVTLATAEFPFDAPIRAHVLTHTGEWISGHVRQINSNAAALVLEADSAIEGGTSGGPVVTRGRPLARHRVVIWERSRWHGPAPAYGCTGLARYAMVGSRS
jgi:hypothetical protein